MPRRLTRLALTLSLFAWLGMIAVPAVNAQGGDGIWIRLCLGTGTSWVQLSLDDKRSTQNNHCPCTHSTLDTAWNPSIATRPPLPVAPTELPLALDPKPAKKLPYLSRAPPHVSDTSTINFIG
ncbi:hypothetical protein [Saccharospirillum sp. MSK14-1]|uniref:hypothetical protein n=1 Tax=Saccharospirillum sp. MSK14-1 TaxID=1897632 RepID=UPI0011B2409C|nr:hypothetical protein [Saccharospirillum sp. MSK14-1]